MTDALVEQFLNYLRAERDASPLTLRNYSADIHAFRVWFEEKFKHPPDWARIDPFHLRGYLVHLSEGRYDRATIHLKMSALRSFFRWLVRAEHVKQNPLIGLTLPKKHRKLPKFLTVQQVEALLDAPLKSETAPSRPHPKSGLGAALPTTSRLGATKPFWKHSTARACASTNWCSSTMTTSICSAKSSACAAKARRSGSHRSAARRSRRCRSTWNCAGEVHAARSSSTGSADG